MSKQKPPVKLAIKIEYSPCPDYPNRMQRVVDILWRSYCDEYAKPPPKKQQGDNT